MTPRADRSSNEYSSYNLRIVTHENIVHDDYLTVSAQGVTRVQRGETEFTNLDRWEQEYKWDLGRAESWLNNLKMLPAISRSFIVLLLSKLKNCCSPAHSGRMIIYTQLLLCGGDRSMTHNTKTRNSFQCALADTLWHTVTPLWHVHFSKEILETVLVSRTSADEHWILQHVCLMRRSQERTVAFMNS